MDVDDIRFRIAAARRILYREGCDSNVGGHVSARAEDGATRSGSPASSTSTRPCPTACAKLDFDLDPLVGDLELSPAVNFHAADLPASPRRQRHRAPALALRVRAVVDRGQTVGMYNVVVGAVPRRAGHLLRRRREAAPVGGRRARRQARRAHEEPRRDRRVATRSRTRPSRRVTLEQAARYHLECVAAGGTEILEDEVRRRARRCTASTSCPRCGTPTSPACAAPTPTCSPGSTDEGGPGDPRGSAAEVLGDVRQRVLDQHHRLEVGEIEVEILVEMKRRLVPRDRRRRPR